MSQREGPVPRTETERALFDTVRAGVLLVMPLIVTTDTLFPFIVEKAIYSRSVIEISSAIFVVLASAYPVHGPRPRY